MANRRFNKQVANSRTPLKVGGRAIEDGDFVIIFTLSHDVSEVERLFQVNIDFS